MREIKFRGKRIDNGEWVYGGYHKHLKITPSPIGYKIKDEDYCDLIICSGFSDWNMPKPIQGYEVIPETVGQYTGLKDKNGKEIYEDDVVKCWNGQFTTVKWNKKYCKYQLAYFANTNQSGNPNTIGISEDGEVIGNIHDNPELLEVLK